MLCQLFSWKPLGKGIIPMHDFQKHTAEALPTLLSRLKAGGYRSCR
jgi:hypothetical protein